MAINDKNRFDDFRQFLIDNTCIRALGFLDQHRLELQKIDNIEELMEDFMDDPERTLESLEKRSHHACLQK